MARFSGGRFQSGGGGIPTVESTDELPDAGSEGDQILVKTARNTELYEWDKNKSAWVSASNPPLISDARAQTKTASDEKPSTQTSSPEDDVAASSRVTQTETAVTEQTTESTPLTDIQVENT